MFGHFLIDYIIWSILISIANSLVLYGIQVLGSSVDYFFERSLLYSLITMIFNIGSNILVVFISIKSVAKKYILEDDLNVFLKYIKILYGIIFLLYIVLGISSGAYLAILFNGIITLVIYIITCHFSKKLIKNDYDMVGNSQNFENNSEFQNIQMNNQSYDNYNISNNEQPTYGENNNFSNNEIYNTSTNFQTEQINNSGQNNYFNGEINTNQTSLNNSQLSKGKINYFSDNK